MAGNLSFFHEWADAGVFYVGQLFNADGFVKSWPVIRIQFGLVSPLAHFQYLQIVSLIPRQWKRTLREHPHVLAQRQDSFETLPSPKLFDYKRMTYVPLLGANSRIFYTFFGKHGILTSYCSVVLEAGPGD